MHRFIIFAALVLGVLIACGEDTDTGPSLRTTSCPSTSTCPSFANDIFPSMKASGAWKCADGSCHGGGTSPPTIDDSSASACLASLKKITVRGKPYIASGTDPNASSLLCNLKGSCGSQMPKSPGTNPSSAEVCKVEAWLRCGAAP
jgi:hypothetical protein